ncbi:MAG: ATP-binding protein [Acidobacteriota bacterium]
MRNLYFKIFIWFWLAMALVGAALVISTVTTQTGERSSRWRPLVGNGLALNGRFAAQIYEHEGQPGLAEFLQRLELNTRTTPFLFNEEIEELSGRSLPEGAKELAARAAHSGETEVAVNDGGRLVARPVTGPSDQPYVIVGEIRRFLPTRGPRRFFPFWWRFDEPQELATRLLAVFLTAGVVCYGLARYLTSPVLKLRDATRRLSRGDLSVRVGSAVGKRHDELADLGGDFDLMAERIESLVTTQRRLLSDISHELRSPLARLNVALGLARQRAGPEAGEALARIERESERLNQLIGQVLVLARLESGAEESDGSPVNLTRLVVDVAADGDFEARSQKRSVRVVASEGCWISGHDELLRSAIENVVRNAVRYTAEGTDVEISLDCVDADAGSAAVISVRDHGPGVAPEALGDLFRPFYRVADARDRASGGTGLGLAITQRAVQIHGGRVEAANAPGGGLLVEIHLPV